MHNIDTWAEKQQYMVRFINEIGTRVDALAAEFDLPPVLIVGMLENIKNEWLNPEYHIVDDTDDTENSNDL